LGGIYAIYCNVDYLDTDLGAAVYQDSFTNCIAACDAYNIVYFSEGSPCRGVSYYNSTLEANCHLQTSTNFSTAQLGIDSAKLLNPQQPANNVSTVTVTTTIFSGSGGPTIVSTVTGSNGITTVNSGGSGNGVTTVVSGGSGSGGGPTTIISGGSGNGGNPTTIHSGGSGYGVTTIVSGGSGTGGGNGGPGTGKCPFTQLDLRD
jgi:hypothetical protein